MKKILIASSPRCGTQLLMRSLEQHPDAVCTGELFNNRARNNQNWSVSENRAGFIERHNLFKSLVIYRMHPDFEQFLNVGLMVYLYRRDMPAQIRSWKRAARTGVWAHGQASQGPSKVRPDHDYENLIRLADKLFLRRADIVIAYEEMVANWQPSVQRILRLAGWNPLELSQATRKQSA